MDQREGAFARGADNMKERPILFSAPMVRALLDGRKTQTRRAVKISHRTPGLAACLMPTDPARVRPDLAAELCPYGHPGDRLWVRESGWERSERTAKMMREGADTWPRFAYAADDWSDQDRADFKAWGFKARPSIHMPRWASRITLEITGVRVERLREISKEDAIAEGVNVHPDHHGKPRDSIYSPVQAYRDLLLEAVKKYADRQNWGYYDDSGCDKGHGEYTDACFIGPEVAQAAITAVEGEK